MSLSVRLFGLNSWALLIPQALMGVATTWLIYKIIRQGHPAGPALLGGLVYATTPVVVLMSRYNNPEPLMGLLTVAAFYFVIRAIDDNRWAWYLLAGTALGLGFMAKQIQAFLPIPALVLAVLLFGAGTLGSRVLRLLASLGALTISGGWWLAIVDLTPAADRPYVGGSASNSMLELTLDYNGLARFIRLPISANGTATKPGAGDEAPFDGGLSRLFNGNFAPEASWLVFTAGALALVLAVLPYLLDKGTSARVIGLVAGTWFASTFLLLSFMGTMVHTYYTFSLAPPIAIMVPVGLAALWKARDRLAVRLIGAAIIGGSSYLATKILQYSDDYPWWMAIAIIIVGLLTAIGWTLELPQIATQVLWLMLVLSLIGGPAAANLHTVASSQQGTNPISGPISSDPRAISRHLDDIRRGNPAWARQIAYGDLPDPAVLAHMVATNTEATWIAATYSAQNAAQYQLASGRPVMAIGGWLGTDPAPTLEQFVSLVTEKRVSYFIWQQDLLDLEQLGPETVAISEWVNENFTFTTIKGVRIYDLNS